MDTVDGVASAAVRGCGRTVTALVVCLGLEGTALNLRAVRCGGGVVSAEH